MRASLYAQHAKPQRLPLPPQSATTASGLALQRLSAPASDGVSLTSDHSKPRTERLQWPSLMPGGAIDVPPSGQTGLGRGNGRGRSAY